MKQLRKKLGALMIAALVALGSIGAAPMWANAAEADTAETSDANTSEASDADAAETSEQAETADAAEVSWPAGPEIASSSAIVVEANTGTVLYEKNADDRHYPASITKIMTTLVALENSSLDETVTFSEKAVYENEGDTSHIARDIDEQMTMEQCLYAVMLESANECAYAVAEHIGGGDAQAFVDLMNEKAAELGCTGTNFCNPNGLPNDNHVTTCRDMAKIAKAAIENATFRQITGTVRYTIPPTNKHEEETNLNNHHQMLSSYKGTKYLYDGCIGGKTGYTDEAGNTLVTYAERDGMLLICVVMDSQATQYQDTTALLDDCFANYKLYNVSQNETRFADSGNTSSLFGEADAFAELDSSAQIVLPVTANFADTTTEISYDNVSENVIGTLVYSYGGRTCGTADVVTTGASAAMYEFGEAVSGSEDGSADAETVSDGADTSGGKSVASVLDKLRGGKILPKILILVGIAVAAVLVILFLYNNIRHYIRRKRRRERRYKVIKENRRWRRRRGRW